MVAYDPNDFDPRYSRLPMTFADAVAALFRPRTKKMQAAADSSTVDAGGLERIGAKAPMGDSSCTDRVPETDTTQAA